MLVSLSFGRESGSAQRADHNEHYAMALPLAAAAGVGAGAPGGGVPPEAPAAPVPPPAAPVIALPRNYREMFSDAVHSPAPDRTREYLQGYRFTDGGLGPLPTPATMRDQTVTLCNRHQKVRNCKDTVRRRVLH